MVSNNANPIVIRPGLNIGTGNAETDDDFLFDCFVDYAPVAECKRVGSPVMVVSGRTGEGKTAIIRYIEGEVERSVSIDPSEMSMNYVSNSDALRFLTQIGANLDLLFQVLWKHVLCIEFIRLRWDVNNTQKSKNIFQKLVDKFNRDERRAKAIQYLHDWQGKFWITMDENIKEITESVENRLHAEIGSDIDKFSAGGQYDKRLSAEKKTEIIARSKKIIQSDQLATLHNIIDLLSVAENDQLKDHYILIDGLDERWVDEAVRFRLIRALIESLKSFRKIRNLKILVSLRVDVFERVVQDATDISFQREKFEDVSIRLRWTKDNLRELVETRIDSLFRRQFTKDSVGFYDIFPEKVANKPTFDWMVERTLMRPRDMIAFVNEALDAATGRPEISVTALKIAEKEFSRKRKDALVQEWKSAYPSLKAVLKLFAGKKKAQYPFAEFCEPEIVDEIALEILSGNEYVGGPLHDECQTYMNTKAPDPTLLMSEMIALLYRVGAVGLKLDNSEPYIYSHRDRPLISPHLLTSNAKVRLHPMLHAAYHLHEKN